MGIRANCAGKFDPLAFYGRTLLALGVMYLSRVHVVLLLLLLSASRVELLLFAPTAV